MGILLQAIRDIVSPNREAQAKDEDWESDAVEWFESEAKHPGSLDWVCAMLKSEPTRFRQWIRDYRSASYTGKMKMLSGFSRQRVAVGVRKAMQGNPHKAS